jgi:phenylpropionate dioxygenase-like ring-hydroxylating dioxygenase large terminal subunit
MTLLAPDRLETLKRSLAQGYALPSDWYTDPALFDRERDAVLRRGWHFAAHTDELAKVGDQVVGRVAGVPVVLVRDEAMTVRGFVNICRHRAHQVVLQNQNQRSLQCLYHGWTYGLDGQLRAAPRSKHEPCFDAGDFPLAPVQVFRWGPTVWVNVDRDAPPFEAWTEGLQAVVARHVDVGAHRFAFEKTWRIRANWKVFLDNAIECYHCATCHPTLARALEMDPTRHVLSLGSPNWVTTEIPFRARAARAGGAESDVGWIHGGGSEAAPSYIFHWIFPTSYFQYTNGGKGFDIGSIRVLAVDEIEFRAVFFVPQDMPQAEVAERMASYDADPVVGEDVAICERVQDAHQAGVAQPGRLMLGSEWHLQHFQQRIVEMIAAAP